MSEQNNKIKITCTESQADFIRECGCIVTNHDDIEDCCHCDSCPFFVDFNKVIVIHKISILTFFITKHCYNII